MTANAHLGFFLASGCVLSHGNRTKGAGNQHGQGEGNQSFHGLTR
jgi:hypothetical protein